MTLRLTSVEQAMLDGSEGEGVALAMRIVTGLARVRGAEELVEVTGAHIDSCLYHGRAGLDFAEKLVELGARVRIPTTLNVGSLDLMHPGTVRADEEHPDLLTAGRALMDAYVAMGARATFTCAPYQVDARPGLGEHVAWAESNAIVFANSVLGARTDRYGDFLDICAAITGRAPRAGFHLDNARRADFVIDVSAVASHRWDDSAWYAVLGHLLGGLAGQRVGVIVGLPTSTKEDDLKASARLPHPAAEWVSSTLWESLLRRRPLQPLSHKGIRRCTCSMMPTSSQLGVDSARRTGAASTPSVLARRMPR